MEESKPKDSPEETKPPNNEQQLNNPSTDEPIEQPIAEKSTEVDHNEIPPSSGTEQQPTTNKQPQTDSMEVHHHSHPSAGSGHRKKWTHYFWEFLMLFLAVFCGFLAEYQLEHKIERDRAKELAKSFYEELKSDSITAGIKVANRLKQEASLRYLIKYFKDSSLTNVPKEFALSFVYGISFLSPSTFEPRTVMLDQLRNSGSLRYFKNDEFQNLTGDLTVAVKNINHRQDLEVQNRILYINPLVIKHYDYDFDNEMKKGNVTIFEGVSAYEKSSGIIPFHLNNPDKIDRKDLVSLLSFYNANALSSTRQIHYQKYIEVNAKLLQILRTEYHLK